MKLYKRKINAEKNQTEELTGYLTIEAAIIVPIALFCILLILFLAFFQYDRCLLEQDLKMTMLRTSNMTYYTNQELYNELHEQKLYLNEIEYPNFTWIEQKHKIGPQKTEVSVMGKVHNFFGGLLFSAPSTKLWGIDIKETLEKYDPVSFIRKCRRLGAAEKMEE